MSAPDFSEFPHPDYEQWLRNASRELASGTWSDWQWKNENGFEVDPYPPAVQAIPAASVRRATNEPCSLRHVISETEPAEANRHAKALLATGADALTFTAPFTSESAFETAVAGIQLEILDVVFTAGPDAVQNLRWILNWCQSHHVDSKSLRGGLAANPSGDETFAELLRLCATHFSLFRIWDVSSVDVHEAGGNAVQELVSALALGSDFLHRADEAGFGVDAAAAMLQFRFGISSTYFEQMAKLRTFRFLWSQVAAAFIPSHDCSYFTSVHAETSARQQAAEDPHNNLLRATTQAMSAIIGGADSIYIRPFDAATGTPSRNAERLASNMYHLLMTEAQMNAADPAAGAIYIEQLCARLADEAWTAFLAVEADGGYEQAKERLQREIAEAGAKKQQAERSGEKVIIGVNKYRQS